MTTEIESSVLVTTNAGTIISQQTIDFVFKVATDVANNAKVLFEVANSGKAQKPVLSDSQGCSFLEYDIPGAVRVHLDTEAHGRLRKLVIVLDLNEERIMIALPTPVNAFAGNALAINYVPCDSLAAWLNWVDEREGVEVITKDASWLIYKASLQMSSNGPDF